MENPSILPLYLLLWAAYVFAIHFHGHRHRLRPELVGLSHAGPSLVAGLMTWIFLLHSGSTVRQFAAGSESHMNLWSLWVEVWPFLLLINFMAGIGHVCGIGCSVAKPSARKWLPVFVTSAVMCAFAFITVLTNFPDA